jgi:hypothetical protein
MPKRISLYLNDQDQAVLDKLCKSGKCTPSQALRSGLHRLNNEPAAPARADLPADEAPAEIHPGEFVFHEGLLDKEARLQKEEREKRLQKARADADAYINAGNPDLMTKMIRKGLSDSSIKDMIRKELGEIL